jgi:hypothetical protein
VHPVVSNRKYKKNIGPTVDLSFVDNLQLYSYDYDQELLKEAGISFPS